jgi:hypothetical protein
VFLARIIALCLLCFLLAFNGEGKGEPVAASSTKWLIRVVDWWFIRVLKAKNGTTWRRTPKCFADSPRFTLGAGSGTPFNAAGSDLAPG